ncbi:MAG: hypothetical protein V7706_11905 [Dietzia psychralcaliphila]
MTVLLDTHLILWWMSRSLGVGLAFPADAQEYCERATTGHSSISLLNMAGALRAP